MYELAKKSREGMKSKARRLAAETDRKVDSSDWSPAPPLRAEMKTGARPITKPSSKGIGESNKAADTKAALGSAHRGGFKDGGGVFDKKALGAIDPRPKRAAAANYKKGGRVKREDGGKLPTPYESMRSEERRGTMKVEEKRKLPSAAEAAKSAARVGDVPEGRKHGGRKARASGGRAKSKPSISISILAAGKPAEGAPPMVPPMGRAQPVPMPTMQAPPPGAVPPPPMPMADPMSMQTPSQRARPIQLKTGGRVSKSASSYKDMTAGAESGMGRLQKTSIAEKRKGAPARKDGGRISKVAKSYKDMTAGAESGEGRLQKRDIARAKKVRAV